MNGTAEDYEECQNHCMWMAVLAPNDGVRRSLLRLADHCETEARLVEKSRACLTESRELLARVDTLFSARPTARKEEGNPQSDILRKAMERVFDEWIDRKASPLRRSMLLH